MTDDHERIANWLVQARQAVGFTGAGISTESGIPDFRSPGGVWSKVQPVYYDDFLASATARHEYWRQKSLAHPNFDKARPNTGHQVLADWEQRGHLRGVITQNIDELHQQAGSQKVLELHGTCRKVACLDCGFRDTADAYVRRFLDEDMVPPCPECQGRLKAATVSFGQSLPMDVMDQAVGWSRDCDLFFAIGSSLVVEPAASLPRLAKRSGARLVIINRDPTPLDSIADLVLREAIGAALRGIDQCLSTVKTSEDR